MTQETEQEPCLTYRREVHRWEGEDALVSVFANPNALARKISAYLREQGLKTPTMEERNHALEVVSALSYWHDYQGRGEGISMLHKEGGGQNAGK